MFVEANINKINFVKANLLYWNRLYIFSGVVYLSLAEAVLSRG